MASSPSGLGKGLNALIRETSDAREPTGVKTLRIDEIMPNPGQPRKHFTDKALQELANSIKNQGILQPLLVRPFGSSKPGKYEIVAGERRWRASQLAGLTEVPVFIRTLSEEEVLTAALIENLQREDLNPVEEALGIQTLKDEFGLSQEDLAKKLGKSRSAIANSLRLLTLPEAIRTDLAEGSITAGHARTLLSINDERAQEYLRAVILKDQISVREAEALAATWKETGTFQMNSPFCSSLPPFEQQAENNKEQNAQETATEKKAKPQSAKILEIQNRIGSALSLPVRVTGKETKGKISLQYNSKEELETLLERLALLAAVTPDETHTEKKGMQVNDAAYMAGKVTEPTHA